jgi:putative ABC transport system permease protein
MKFLPLILRQLGRNPLRTCTTAVTIALSIVALCAIEVVRTAIAAGGGSSGGVRLVSRHASGLAYNVPLGHRAAIAQVPGVRAVAAANWFGGLLKTGRSFFFTSMAVDAEPYLAIYPEYVLSESDRTAFLADRSGCVIGPEIARRLGWRVGDRFHMESFIAFYRAASGPLEFTVRGVYALDHDRFPWTSPAVMLFHHRYLEETTGRKLGASTFVVQIADPAGAGAIGHAIDALFENSDFPTVTETESAFQAGVLSSAGNFTWVALSVGLAMGLTTLLVSANAMSMSVRERRRELAILKTLGFGPRLLLSLVLAEGLLLGGVGGLLGVAATRLLLAVVPDVPLAGDAARALGGLRLGLPLAALGVAGGLLTGGVSGALPSLSAFRVRVAEQLRTV